jgi:hypothetical protein
MQLLLFGYCACRHNIVPSQRNPKKTHTHIRTHTHKNHVMDSPSQTKPPCTHPLDDLIQCLVWWVGLCRFAECKSPRSDFSFYTFWVCIITGKRKKKKVQNEGWVIKCCFFFITSGSERSASSEFWGKKKRISPVCGFCFSNTSKN